MAQSSHSGGTSGDCVEIASLPGAVAVRDSKNPRGPKLAFSRAAWNAFTAQVNEGSHDL